MFDSLKAIKTGNIKQKKAYAAIIKLHIFEDLKSYSPILCGTIPLDIDTEESDLDIILNVTDLDLFKAKVNKLYGLHSSFKKKHTFIRNRNVLVTSFYSDGFEFQLFAQNQPTSKQYAYLHMIVEWQILEKQPELRKKIRRLKKLGIKTEPAFCHILGLTGDPYEALIEYGIKHCS